MADNFWLSDMQWTASEARKGGRDANVTRGLSRSILFPYGSLRRQPKGYVNRTAPKVLVQFPINGCSFWQNDFLGSMPPEPPPKALERSLVFWSAV